MLCFENSSHLKYRSDIDGLRAIAVFSVVLFHAYPASITGGFVGVDIFFVISGFLISSNIFTTLQTGRFSVVEFYTKRIRRIFPALITVMLTSLMFGWFILLADEYKQLGKHIAGGVGFVSNFILSSERGYFENTAETKPMLHLWSLSIEEQFYIFWPLLLEFIFKCQLRFLPIAAILIVGSFIANIYGVGGDLIGAFYSPICRFWELIIGGVLADVTMHYPQLLSRYKNARSLIGFLLIVVGLITINKYSQFPGWWALLPTFGATLLISAGSTAWINKTILSNKVMVWFGLISYPLYLWHWPLLSFANIIEGKPSIVVRTALVIASVFLAWLTYIVVEKPLRFARQKKISLLLLFTFLITGIFGYTCQVSNGYVDLGFRNRAQTEFAEYFENDLPKRKYFKRENMHVKFRDKCNYSLYKENSLGEFGLTSVDNIDKECYLKKSNVENSLMIWGDSYGSHLYHGIKKNIPNNWQILQVTTSDCKPDIMRHNSIDNYCDKSNLFAMKTIESQRPKVVIVAQKLDRESAKKMLSISSKLESSGVQKVIFTGSTPRWNSDLPRTILRKLWNNTPQRTFVGIDNKTLQANQVIKHEFRSSAFHQFVSIIDYFCNKDGCLTRIGSDRKLGITTWDTGHLTPIASDALAKDILVPLIVKPSDSGYSAN